MTGRVRYTPEAEQQLDDLDEWITKKASAAVARRFVAALMGHIDGIAGFPSAGHPRGDIRPGMRTSSFRKRTLVVYEVDESTEDVIVNVLGVFHGGQDWEGALTDQQTERETGR